jgi:SAM-dependent methyltransferase
VNEQLFGALESAVGPWTPALLRCLTQLRDWMGADRERRLSGYMNQEGHLRAYMAYYLPLHLPEVFWIMDQRRSFWKDMHVERLVDVGCGPGTATLSYLLWCHHVGKELPKEIVLADFSRKVLEQAAGFVKILAPEARIVFERGEWSRMRRLDGDLIFMSHVLNEEGGGPRAREGKQRKLDAFLRFGNLREGGTLLIVEPPLKTPTLDLMWLRDALSENPDARVVAPCPAGTLVCPLARQKLGWCYSQPPRTFARALGLAPWDQRLERALRIELTNPGFSYVAFTFGEVEGSLYSIAVSDETRKPGFLCEGKKIARAKGSVPFRGAYVLGKGEKDSPREPAAFKPRPSPRPDQRPDGRRSSSRLPDSGRKPPKKPKPR